MAGDIIPFSGLNGAGGREARLRLRQAVLAPLCGGSAAAAYVARAGDALALLDAALSELERSKLQGIVESWLSLAEDEVRPGA